MLSRLGPGLWLKSSLFQLPGLGWGRDQCPRVAHFRNLSSPSVWLCGWEKNHCPFVTLRFLLHKVRTIELPCLPR